MERRSVLNIFESNKKLGQQKAAALWLASFKRLGLRLGWLAADTTPAAAKKMRM